MLGKGFQVIKMQHSHHKHEHHHNHEHGEHHDCSCETEHSCSCETRKENFWVDGHLHDGATVVSGEGRLLAEYDHVSSVLKAALEELAAAVTAQDGIVGHIKAAVEISSVEMFSVTDEAVTVKRSKEQEIVVQTAAIVFGIELAEMKALVQSKIMDKLKALQPEQ
jgi:ABC-type Zn2+ transport system substrate-binding protein/surface adhesin